MPGKSVGNGTFSKKILYVSSYIGGISWLIYQHELTIIKLKLLLFSLACSYDKYNVLLCRFIVAWWLRQLRLLSLLLSFSSNEDNFAPGFVSSSSATKIVI